jgi:hypothetical protein
MSHDKANVPLRVMLLFLYRPGINPKKNNKKENKEDGKKKKNMEFFNSESECFIKPRI